MTSSPTFHDLLLETAPMNKHTDWSARIERAYLLHVKPEVYDRYLDPRPIGLAEYKEFRGNTYERLLLAKKFDDETLAYVAEYTLSQIGERHIPTIYDETLASVYAPLLIQRLRDAARPCAGCETRDMAIQKYEMRERDVVNALDATRSGVPGAETLLEDAVKPLRTRDPS